MQLAKKLKSLLKEKGVSVASLSRSTSISSKTLYGWLGGIEPKNLNQIKKLADYFNISIEELCFGVQPKIHNMISDYKEEIFAGEFDVVLRRKR